MNLARISEIKSLRASDKDMLRALARAGVCTDRHLFSFGNGKGITKNRMQSHIVSGFVQKQKYFDKKSRAYQDCYFLTKKGVNLVKQQLDINYIYHSNSRVHDIALMDKYISLDRNEQNSWLTESYLGSCVDVAEIKAGHLSPTDGVYISSDTHKLVTFDIVTDNYGKAEIKAKEMFTQAIGGELITQKI